MRNLYILILTFFLTNQSISQTIITDRPDQTESSSIVDAGSLQIESGMLITENHNHKEKSLYLPSTLFRLGLTSIIELRVLHQFEYQIDDITSRNGFNDLELGVKMQLLKKENGFTEMAFLSHISIPTASDFFSENKVGVINKLCFSHNTNSKIGIGYNIGYNYFEHDPADLTYSLVLGIAVNEQISTYFEPYGQINDFNTLNTDWESNVNMGITYLLTDNIQLDYAFGTGLNYKFNFMSIGCSVNVF